MPAAEELHVVVARAAHRCPAQQRRPGDGRAPLRSDQSWAGLGEQLAARRVAGLVGQREDVPVSLAVADPAVGEPGPGPR